MKRPSVATVLAALALFVSLSGTAIASVIISNNSQVGAHTIAGADAKAGQNQNLIPGTVGSNDLHSKAVSASKLAPGSVGSSAVANGSITGNDLDLNSVPGAVGIHSGLLAMEPGGATTIASVGMWLVGGDCTNDGGGKTDASVELDNMSGTQIALLSVGDSAGQFVNAGEAAVTLLAQTPQTLTDAFAGGTFTAQSIGTPDHISGRVMAVVDTSGNSFQGTSMTAPFCVFRFDGVAG